MYNKKKKFFIILSLLVYSVLIISVSYYYGKAKAQTNKSVTEDNFEETIISYEDTCTIYAQITDIQDDVIYIKGNEINDINGRGNYFFTVSDDTKILWRSTDISKSDLHVNDNISITYTGCVEMSDPANIETVLRINLLDDEIN